MVKPSYLALALFRAFAMLWTMWILWRRPLLTALGLLILVAAASTKNLKYQQKIKKKSTFINLTSIWGNTNIKF